MAPIQTLQFGVPHTLLENVVYALPVNVLQGFVADPASVLEISMDASGWTTVLVGADGAWYTSAPFIRTTDPDASVIVKSY